MNFLILTLTMAFISGYSFAQGLSTQTFPIYGNDDRSEFKEASPRHQMLAESTAAQIVNRFLIKKPGGKFVINAPDLETMSEVCNSERYRDQPAAALCSGTLIGPDLLLTAAHCYTNKSICQNTSWVFGYHRSEKKRYHVPKKNLYRCREIVYKSFDIENGHDFAIVKLDRPVTGRAPLKLRQSGSAALLTPLVLIGHPLGLPTKIAGDAWVTSMVGNTLYTNVDSYTGNSGSGVFNADTGELEGVLSHGKEDFLDDPKQLCRISQVYDMNDGGEAVMGIAPVRDFMDSYRPRQ